MADAIVSVVLEQLTESTVRELKSAVSLLLGARKVVESLPETLRTIKAVLKTAEERQVTEEAVKVWLDKLKEAAYDMDDVLDEWNTWTGKLQIERAENALTPKKKVCSFFLSPGFCFRQVAFRFRIASKIKDLYEGLDAIAKERETHGFYLYRSVEQSERVKTTSFVDVSEIQGRDEEKSALLSKLLSESSNEQSCFRVISILGMGGIGKTSLAQLAYNSNEVTRNFHKRIWVCVSDPFDEFRVAQAIVEALTGAASYSGELQAMFEDISKHVEGKKFLLVLDDVWTEDDRKWKPLFSCLQNGLQGSKILVTTRNERIANLIQSNDIIIMKELHEEKCWLLFKRLAFFDRPEQCEKLEDIGRKIVSKCKGLPLAVKIIASLLRFKKTKQEWQNVLESEMWKLEKFEKELFPTLLLSYNDLPLMVRRCFSYCSIFPKDYEMRKDQMIQLWMAQGYLNLEQNQEMEITGREYFDVLAMRSFFQDFKKDMYDDDIESFKMHDMVHDFAQFLTKNECFGMEQVNIQDEASISYSSYSYEKAHHAMLVTNTEVWSSLISSLCKFKKLRSLLVETSSPAHPIGLSKLFHNLTYLRALGLKIDGVSPVVTSREIEKLVHLRCLKISSLGGLKELPEALCELYNLQTLDLSHVTSIQKLPQNIGKLINLRHLRIRIFEISYIPKGIEKLTNLLTLHSFVVSGNEDHDMKPCSLEGLKNLNNLRSLRITGLENVRDVNEVKRAELHNKKNLLALDLYFEYGHLGNANRMREDDKEILESFQLPSSLEKLETFNYGGSALPQDWTLSLKTVKVLKLSSCANLKQLPPLGKLPSLELLFIGYTKKVKRVGDEFLGIERDGTSSISFPKLRSLTLRRLDELEEWDSEIASEGKENIRIMPCLCTLEIAYCEELKTMPKNLLQSAPIEKLMISRCPTLKQHCKEETGDYWPKICHIPNIQILDIEDFELPHT